MVNSFTPIKCPSCGQSTKQDFNSFECAVCKKLWPKGAGWENEFDNNAPAAPTAYGIQPDDLVRIHSQRCIYKVIDVSECRRYAKLVSESSGRERLEAITNLNLVERP